MDDVLEEISNLVEAGQWRKVLETYDRNKFLPWIWPSQENLELMASSVTQLGAEGIVSIGCGSGLLEWLLSSCTGVPVRGIEVDRSWWTSPHCQAFLKLEFTQDFHKGQAVASSTEALLFCYFNNEPAFLDYLTYYSGPCLIVIGPGEERGTHTAPRPLALPTEAAQQWTLFAVQEVKSGLDFIAIYKRIRESSKPLVITSNNTNKLQ